jgi:hypothetical protein
VMVLFAHGFELDCLTVVCKEPRTVGCVICNTWAPEPAFEMLAGELLRKVTGENRPRLSLLF